MSYVCRVCSCSFRTLQHLNDHNSSVKHRLRVDKTVDLFDCKTCGKQYMYKSGLSVHKKKCEAVVQISNSQAPPPENTEENTEEKDEMKAEILRQRSIISALESRCKDLDQLEKRCKQLEAQLEKKKTFVTIQQQGRRKLSKDTRQEVATRQEDKCNKCQTNLTKYYQIDHKTGLQFGGSDEFDNLQALCCECHAEKSILENQHRKEIQEAIRTILIKHGQ